MDYWKECVECAFDESGIVATEEQILSVSRAVSAGFDGYTMAYPVPHSNAPSEIATLKEELDKERSKKHCRTCDGSGRIISYFGTFQSNSQCDDCHGEGKVA